MSQIYSSYRSGKYKSIRRTWEPWYTSGINELYTSDDARVEVSARKERMSRQFQQAKIEEEFTNCLDFGGDDGQFFPDSIRGNRYLVDLSSSCSSHRNSEITIVPNIEAIPEKLDLIMSCMVMEHLSSFAESMSAITRKLFRSGTKQKGLFYLEIPRDSFNVGNWAKSSAYYNYLTLISKVPPLFIVLDFLTGVSRNFFRTIPIFGIVKQSEHINYFSEKAISKLVGKYLEVLFVSDENLKETYGYFRLGFLALIARRN